MAKTVIFSAFDNAGVTIGTVSVSGNISYNTRFNDYILNQSSVVTVDGDEVVTGNGVKYTVGQIEIREVSYSDGENFRDFLRDTLVFRANKLGIDLLGASADLGKGLGVNIVFSDNCRYLTDNGEDSANTKIPLVVDILLKYKFFR